MDDRTDTSAQRRAMPLLWLLAAGVVWFLSRPAAPPPMIAGADVYVVRTAFHPTLSLAAMLVVFAMFYGVSILTNTWYRTWIAYAQLALMAGGGLMILAPAVFLRTIHVVPADPLAVFQFWNQVSAIGYAMIPLGVLAGVLMAIDSRANGPKRSRRPA